MKVDDHPVIGLKSSKGEPAIFHFKAGYNGYGVARMTLGLAEDGAPKNSLASTNWCLGDIVQGKWLINDLIIKSMGESPDDPAISDPAIVEAFKGSDGKMPEMLFCIAFHVTHPQFKFCDDRMWDKVSDIDRPALKILFAEKMPYKIRIWFFRPISFPDVETQCLDILRTQFRNRLRPCSLEDYR